MSASLSLRLTSGLKRLLAVVGEHFASDTTRQILIGQELAALKELVRESTPDNPALQGYKVYSQADEDGILHEVFRRIGEGGKTFVEIGCGDGTENNTHLLLLREWRGVWIDGSAANVRSIGDWLPLSGPRLQVRQALVDRDNVLGLVSGALARLEVEALDLLSVDIDGNDLFVLGALVPALRPRVIAAEYNSRFPPPLSIGITYDAAHVWARDDYHGASLQALADALGDYRLVACNLSGANAFFVRKDLAAPFASYPIEQLFQPARHHLIHLKSGAAPSLKFLRAVLGAA